MSAARAAFAATAEPEPGCGGALAVLNAVAGRSAALAAAVNARVLSYNEADAVQVGLLSSRVFAQALRHHSFPRCWHARVA